MSTETKPKSNLEGCLITVGILTVVAILCLLWLGFLEYLTYKPPVALAPVVETFPPFTVLCDGEGHFTFAMESGGVYGGGNYTSREAASHDAALLKKDFDARHNRKFHPCPEPEKQAEVKTSTPHEFKSGWVGDTVVSPSLTLVGTLTVPALLPTFSGTGITAVTFTAFRDRPAIQLKTVGKQEEWKTPLDAQFECVHDGHTYRTEWRKVEK